MMAWILVALLAGVASDAVVDLSPETDVTPVPNGYGPDFPPPKP